MSASGTHGDRIFVQCGNGRKTPSSWGARQRGDGASGTTGKRNVVHTETAEFSIARGRGSRDDTSDHMNVAWG